MIAPKKIDLFCELLVAFQPILVMVAGGSASIQGWMLIQGVPVDVATKASVPIWVPIVCAILAYIVGQVLKMCYPTVQLPTTANTTMTVHTPDLGPEHPSTEIKVQTNAPVVAAPNGEQPHG